MTCTRTACYRYEQRSVPDNRSLCILPSEGKIFVFLETAHVNQASKNVEPVTFNDGGAGVHLHRVFGFGDTKPFDPFLMMDDFRNDDPAKYKTVFHGTRIAA